MRLNAATRLVAQPGSGVRPTSTARSTPTSSAAPSMSSQATAAEVPSFTSPVYHQAVAVPIVTIARFGVPVRKDSARAVAYRPMIATFAQMFAGCENCCGLATANTTTTTIVTRRSTPSLTWCGWRPRIMPGLEAPGGPGAAAWGCAAAGSGAPVASGPGAAPVVAGPAAEGSGG